jgi:hypothetical protein
VPGHRDGIQLSSIRGHALIVPYRVVARLVTTDLDSRDARAHPVRVVDDRHREPEHALFDVPEDVKLVARVSNDAVRGAVVNDSDPFHGVLF